MFKKTFYYLVKVQYLGYRFHGWQKQPNLKTVHHMIDRTLKYVLVDQRFKTLGAGRTDAMVSANEAAFELFVYDKDLLDLDEFIKTFNENLPQDIRAISIHLVDKTFNVIQDPKVKEYHYLFSQGQKNHPFCASIMTGIQQQLDIDVMKKGAKLYEGTHNFRAYCYKPSATGEFQRHLNCSEIIDNTIYTANFFPKQSYIFRVKGKGFMRNQIRLMFGTLINLGKGDVSLKDIEHSLQNHSEWQMNFVAPASGLILHSVNFE